MTNELTAFQQRAIVAIRSHGGSIHYAANKSWNDWTGQRVQVPSADLKTEGFIGWPTIRALMTDGSLIQKGGNEYALTKGA